MSDDPVTAAELEAALRQLHRMELSTRAGLERVEALVTAAIRVLHRAEIVHEKVVHAEVEDQRSARPRDEDITLGPDVDKYAVEEPAIDCASLLHLCKARCCRYSVALAEADLDDGLRWEYRRPYEMRRRRDDGYCVYAQPGTFHCDVYAKRPAICRSYDCRSDKRVWEDFAAKKPAAWQDDVGVAPLVQIRLPGR
jgi:hypothetical protein